nr:nuclear valosin-containing protein-like [Ipomoea batatas]
MEQKRLFMSALGVGVGVGLGLASGQAINKWTGANSSPAEGLTADQIEQELRRLVVDGKDCKVTFDDFPYYLSERTRVLLTSAAYVHLNHMDMSRHTRNLSLASRAILLSGPAELYLQSLAKALAHHFDAKLLLLDIPDFSLKMQSKYGSTKKQAVSTALLEEMLITIPLKRSISEVTLEHMSSLLGSFSTLPAPESNKGRLSRQTSADKLRITDGNTPPVKHRRNASVSSDMSSISLQSSFSTPAQKRGSGWSFDEKDFLKSLYKVLVSISETKCIILYIRDVDRHLESPRAFKLFDRLLKKLSGSMLVLGSQIIDLYDNTGEVDEGFSLLFPYNIEIRPPEDETHLISWKAQLEKDMRMIQFMDNKNHIAEVLSSSDLECEDLGSICPTDTMVLSNYIEEIVVSAISYHLMNNKDPEYRNGRLIISSKRDTLKLETNSESSKPAWGKRYCGCSRGRRLLGLESLPEAKSENPVSDSKPGTEKPVPLVKKDEIAAPKAPEVPPDNEFEKRIRPEVIPPNDIGVTFEDVGSLDEIKESLQELVMLPLRRPDLFNGGLLKPCRGILLFGPPGTGKTMLAKAIANEAGASFINVSMSTITSKWFGEDEKNVRALFTLAAKVSPTIIFVDEVDSMLGQRTRVGEHEAMRKIKNEFMTHWDGLLTKSGERILVLAATNRPFDLDEAIIRRFERRIMVGLPSAESREKILRTLLAKENVADIDFMELAAMTDGYSGSDLKNLCITAAYRPVRELIQQERVKAMQKKRKAEDGQSSEASSDMKEEATKEKVINLRPLNMEDLKQAKNQVAASFASEGSVMGELKQWNELYGEGGSRKKEQLSYFL